MKTKIYNQILLSLKKVYNKRNFLYDPHSPILNTQEKFFLNNVIDSGFVSSIGNYVTKFENSLKHYTKAKYVICLSSGTAALHLALYLLKVEAKNEILIPSFNFVASTNATLLSGATPHFVDCDEKTNSIDVDKLSAYLKKNTFLKNGRCINKITKKTIKVCIPTYSYGSGFDIKKLIKLCHDNNIKVIEDSSEALGTFINSKHAGTFSDFGVLSFNGNKIITTGGGGALLTNSKYLADKAKHVSSTSKKNIKNFSKIHTEFGFNYRMPNLNAGLGYSQILKLNNILKNKKKLFKKLKTQLAHLNNYVEIYEEPKFCSNNYWFQLLKIKDSTIKKDKLLKLLNKNKIQATSAWTLLNSYNYLKKYPSMDLKTSKNLTKNLVCLPSNSFNL